MIRGRSPKARQVVIGSPTPHSEATRPAEGLVDGGGRAVLVSRMPTGMPNLLKASAPSFGALRPASKKASAAARGASRKKNTRCELALRRELWRRGLRYRLHVAGLPGHPDIVFPKRRLVVFCDGDFWHGRDLVRRLAKLAKGHNATYWVAKVERNVRRDRETTQARRDAGWIVVRFWETDVLRSPPEAARRVIETLAGATRLVYRDSMNQVKSQPGLLFECQLNRSN